MNADDFFYSRFPENHELIKGEISPISYLGAFDGFLLAKLNLVISEFVRQDKLGILVANVGFILERNPDTVRGANLAFVSKSRLAQTGITEKFYLYPPNFIAEVASDNRPFEKVKERVDEFLQAGTDLAWVIRHQKGKNLRIESYQANGETFIAEITDEISGENVIKGFKMVASKLLENWLI
jgi:Uma2 family endonuclease